jgi:hypothetical protein
MTTDPAVEEGIPTSTMLELFDKDPMDLGKQDIDAIVLKFRRQRAQFKGGTGNKKAGQPASKQTKASKQAEEIRAQTGAVEIKLPGLDL